MPKALDDEIKSLKREAHSGYDHNTRIEELTAEWFRVEDQRRQLEARWKSEQSLVLAILERQAKLDQGHEEGQTSGMESLAIEIDGMRLALAEIQNDAPMVPHCVDSRAIATVVSSWTGISRRQNSDR